MSMTKMAVCARCQQERIMEAKGFCHRCYQWRRRHQDVPLPAPPPDPQPLDWWPQYLALPTVTCQCGVKLSRNVAILHARRTGHAPIIGASTKSPRIKSPAPETV